jgi:uncharacterized membrane protein
MSRAIIAPIVAVLALIAQAFGVHIPEEVVSEITLHITNAILGVTALIGIFKTFTKKKEEK